MSVTETWRDAAKYLSSLLILDREDERPVASFRGAFIPAVAESFLLRLTEPGDWVWDPFAGGGTTAISAHRHKRLAFLTDLSPVGAWPRADARTASVGQQRVTNMDVPMDRTRPVLDNSETLPRFQFPLVILHPPYHNVITFSDPPVVGDLSHCPDLPAFYNLWTAVCLNTAQHIKPGGYIGLICGNIWSDAQVEPLAHNCMRIALAALGPGARLKAIQVKNIVGNQAFERQKNFQLSRFYRWGAVRFETEMLYSIQKGK